jgi:hypothetical protein
MSTLYSGAYSHLDECSAIVGSGAERTTDLTIQSN